MASCISFTASDACPTGDDPEGGSNDSLANSLADYVNDDSTTLASWNHKTPCFGEISFSETDVIFVINAPAIDLDIHGEMLGFFRPGHTPMNNGHLHFNDSAEFQPGRFDITLRENEDTLLFEFYRYGEMIAVFTVSPLQFSISSTPVDGRGTFV